METCNCINALHCFILLHSDYSQTYAVKSNKTDRKVIKLEFILKLKIERNDWLLVRKQPMVTLYFEFELQSSDQFVSLLHQSQITSLQHCRWPLAFYWYKSEKNEPKIGSSHLEKSADGTHH